MSAEPVRSVALWGMGWFPDEPGGLNRHLHELRRALEDSGVRTTSVVTGPAPDAPDGVTVTARADAPLPRRLAAYSRAARASVQGVDLVDGHFALYAAAPLLSRAVRRTPFVVHFQGPWAAESEAAGEGFAPALVAKRALERAVYRRATALIVLSHAFKQVLVQDYGVAPWRVHVVPPGIDLDRFRPGDQAAARRRLGLPSEARIAVAVRRLVPRMGLDLLLDAWADPGFASGLLCIAGDGPSRAALEDQARRLGIADRVRFLGRVGEDDIAALYQAADVCVVPTVALEGFGLVVLEALACGTPVVASDSGGLPEALAPLDPSLIVPRNDTAALAARLAETASLPTPAACRAYAETYTWPRVAERTTAVYERARGNRESDSLRVVFLDHCAKLSGAELSLADTLPALHGVDLHVILAEDGPLVGLLQQRGISVEVLAAHPAANDLRRDRVRPGRLPVRSALHAAAHTVRLARRIRRLRPDVVHTHSLKSLVVGSAAAVLARRPIVFHIHDRIADDYLPRPAVALIRTLVRWVPAAVIANSEATRATLGAGGADRAFVIPSPVAMADRPVAADAPPPQRPFTAGLVGRLAPWKGQDVFLRAFAAAFGGPDATERAVLVGSALFGEDGFEDDLRRLAAELGIADRVRFAGFTNDVAGELAGMDALVHASTVPEPFGRVIVEGMLAGLPVVAAAAGGPLELIEPDVNGLLVPPGDPEALAAALRRLAADPGLRERLGQAGRVHGERYRPDRVASAIHAVYRRLADAY